MSIAAVTCVVYKGTTTPNIKTTTNKGGFFSGSFSTSSSSLRRYRSLRIKAQAMATEKMGIKIENNPDESKLNELGVRKWPKWGCSPSKFPWKYTSKETCYLLEGKVKVYPDGYDNDFVEFGAGDLVEFPQGMKCTWEISETVDKHYKFE